MTATLDTAPDTPEKTKPDGWIETIRTIVVALLIALALRVVLFQPYTIPSGSMEPGIQVGDYIVVSKWSYGWSRYSLPLPVAGMVGPGRIFARQPTRGDVVVFARPSDPKQAWIKRVIGLPGDEIQMQASELYVNGKLIPRHAVGEITYDEQAGGNPVMRYDETLPNGKTYQTYDQGPGGMGDDSGVYTVPEGQYFVMGDNRDNSADSRFTPDQGVGFLPADNLAGKAQFILASWKPGASLFKPWTWVMNFDPQRILRRID